MKIIECEQLSAVWFQAHLGRVSASDVWKVNSFLKRGDKKGDESEQRAGYKAIKVAELMTGIAVHENYVSPDMENGIEQEPYARAAYEACTGVSVDEVGFIIHPTIERAGASPDGICGAGGIEIKVPRAHNHIRYLTGKPPKVFEEQYLPQILLNMACAEAEWWDFISYCPLMRREHRLYVQRIYRDDKAIEDINSAIVQFNAEVDALIEQLNEIASPADLPPLGKTPRAKLEEQLIGSLTEEDFKNLI